MKAVPERRAELKTQAPPGAAFIYFQKGGREGFRLLDRCMICVIKKEW